MNIKVEQVTRSVKVNVVTQNVVVRQQFSNVEVNQVGRRGLRGADGKPGVVQEIIAGNNILIDSSDPANPIVNALGGGDVESVNGKVGVVTLDSDDIEDTATNRFTNDSDITRLSNTSGTNTGDQDLSSLATLNTDQTITSSKIMQTTGSVYPLILSGDAQYMGQLQIKNRISGTNGNYASIDFFGGGDVTDGNKFQFGQYATGVAFFYNSAPAAIDFYTSGTRRFSIAADGVVSTSTDLDVGGGRIRLRASNPPSNASSVGQAGEMAWDGDYTYVCVATNTWKRSPLTSW